MRLLVAQGGGDLRDTDTFEDTFGVSDDETYTIFDYEEFGPQCVEVYRPDSRPEFRHPPATMDGLPGVALILTTKSSVQAFSDKGDELPTTPEEAREYFLNDPDFEDLGAYGTAIGWGMGAGTFREPDLHVQYAVNGRLFDPGEVKAIFNELQSLAKVTGALNRVGTSRNPYSSLYRPSANAEIELR